MRKKLKFIWVDDNPQRLEGSKIMAKHLKVTIDFKDVKNKDLQSVLTRILKGEEPNLIIIDHNLEDASSGIFKKGSTAAAYIREQWPECPIICISGVDPNLVDSQQRALYEEILPVEHISQYFDDILVLAKSFDAIKNSRPKNVEEFINLLNPPEQERSNLKSIMPTALKENFNDRSLAVEISRWVRGVLLNRPGFLYNEIWAATLVGLKKDAFERLNKKFKPALYTGIFANQSEKRWWKSQLLEDLAASTNFRGLPWEKGRFIKGTTEKDYSKCYASDEDYPETVAFIDQGRGAKEDAMRIKYTNLHPDYESMLLFEDIRLMKPAE